MKIPNKLICLIRMTRDNTRTWTFAAEDTSERGTNTFSVNSGIRLGEPLSATLFTIVLEKVTKNEECK